MIAHSNIFYVLNGKKPLLLVYACLSALVQVLAPCGAADPSGLAIPGPAVLGGIDRSLVFLSTDKPIYKPGETVYARAVVLRADKLMPVRNPEYPVQLRVTGTKGEEVAAYAAEVVDSVAGFSWRIPPETAGGLYTATAFFGGGAASVRTFEIRAYNPPRLRSQIEFLREGYGPGDTVTAVANIIRAEGGAPAGARITAVARVDGEEAARVEDLTVDADGNCRAVFALPSVMERGEGTLAFLIEDGGVVETVSKTIPILLQTLDLDFYPESGDLVAGLPCRVYIQARRPDGKPADIEGEIVPVDAVGETAMGEAVAVAATVHEGRGIAAFTPRTGERYALRVNRPSGIARLFPLPQALDSGAVLRADKEAYEYAEPVTLSVHATPDSGAAVVTLFHRERRAARGEIVTGETGVELLPDDYEGVLMATVWDRDGRPLAERLIFRKPRFAVTVVARVETDPPGGMPTPGGKVRVVVETKDENGWPVEAVVGLAVTDDALLEMVEKRDQAPSLPVMAYLENEVADLADARVYFDPANTDAARDIDLLLGTQGWRRFVLARFEAVLRKDAEGVRRALAMQYRAGRGEDLNVEALKLQLLMQEERLNELQKKMNRRSGKDDFPSESGLISLRRNAVVTLGGAVNTRYFYRNGQLATESDASPAPVAASSMGEEYAPSFSPVREQDEPAGALTLPSAEAANGMPPPAPIPSSPVFPPAANRSAAPESPSFPAMVMSPSTELDLSLSASQHAVSQRVFDYRSASWRKQELYGNLITVREYAHAVRPDRKPNDRADFTETLYWNAGVRTDPRNGTAAVSFGLSDSVSSFRVRADAFADNGALGEGTAEFASVEPFHVDPKMPPVVIMGDRPIVPAVLVNATAEELDRVGLAVRLEDMPFTVSEPPERLAPDARERVLLHLFPDKAGTYSVGVNAAAGEYADAATLPLRVLPRGFPVRDTVSGVASPDAPFAGRLALAREIVPGSLKVSAKLYPTPLANMEEALDALIKRPHGCFEQASSTVFPLIMAQQYFLSHHGASPEKIKRAAELLEEGYRKLAGYECRKNGYDWYGKEPAHEALTAYGLMLFAEMRKVMPIDERMFDRTRRWLLSRRDGKGGFKRSDRATGAFGRASVPLTNLYILWTLLESGEKSETLVAETGAARSLLAETDDPYLLALGANVLHLADDPAAAEDAARRLRKARETDGSVPGAQTSITCSGGESLLVETTSLAILAWLRLGDEHAPAAKQAASWLFERCKAGRFGSTQSTVLALKAINAYDAANVEGKAPGSARLVIDDRPFGQPVVFDEKAQSALEFPDFAAVLSPGEHTVEVVMTGGWRMQVAVEAEYHTPQPVDSPECPLSLATSLSAAEVDEGEPVELTVAVAAKNGDVSMPLAIIGLPAGLEPRHERLKEMVAEDAIASYETSGQDLVLYWRGLPSGGKAELSIPLIARIPGVYTAPASRTYAYYLDEHVRWTAGEKITIHPK